MRQDDSLTVHVSSLTGDVNAEAFIDLLRDTLVALAELNKRASVYGTTNVEWRIVDAGMSSPLFATLHGVSTSQDGDYSPTVIEAFVSGLRQLESTDGVPPLFTATALEHTRDLLKTAAKGVSRIEFRTKSAAVVATKRIAENAVLALRRIEAEKAKRAGEYVEYIEVEGHLKELSELTGKDKIVIADSLTGKKTLCYFRRPDLETKARGAWKHRVSVSGEATVDRSTGELREMEVDELRILRERSELPQMEDLHGIDITGGMESSEYVRGLRDAD